MTRRAAIEQSTMHCPRCRKEYEDFDGFGVLYCPKADGGCGFCRHASRDDDVCNYCGEREEKP